MRTYDSLPGYNGLSRAFSLDNGLSLKVYRSGSFFLESILPYVHHRAGLDFGAIQRGLARLTGGRWVTAHQLGALKYLVQERVLTSEEAEIINNHIIECLVSRRDRTKG